MQNRQTRSLVGGARLHSFPVPFFTRSSGRQAPCDRSRIDPAQPDPHTRAPAPPLHSASRFFLPPPPPVARRRPVPRTRRRDWRAPPPCDLRSRFPPSRRCTTEGRKFCTLELALDPT